MTDASKGGVEQPQGSGCGVQGCLFAAVAIFVILLLGLLVVAVIRFSSPPQPRFGAAGPAEAAPARVDPAPGPTYVLAMDGRSSRG